MSRSHRLSFRSRLVHTDPVFGRVSFTQTQFSVVSRSHGLAACNGRLLWRELSTNGLVFFVSGVVTWRRSWSSTSTCRKSSSYSKLLHKKPEAFPARSQSLTTSCEQQEVLPFVLLCLSELCFLSLYISIFQGLSPSPQTHTMLSDSLAVVVSA